MSDLAVEANLAASDNEQAVEAPQFDAQAEIAKLREQRVKKFEEDAGLETEEEVEATEEPEAVAEEVSEEVETETQDQEEESEEVEDEGDVLSQIDFNALDDETKRAIAEEIGSGAGKEIGKLRGEKKSLQSEIDSLKAQLSEATNLAAPKAGPFAQAKTVEDLEAQATQIEQNAKLWERKLVTEMETEFVGDKEVKGIRDANGTFFPAEQVLDYLDAEREKLKAVPERKAAIQAATEFSSNKTETIEKLKADLFSDNEELAGSFVETISNPKFGLIEEMFPDFAQNLVEMAAYSQLGKTRKPKKKIVLPKKGSKPSGLSVETGASKPQKVRGKDGRYRALGEQISGNNLDAKQRLAAARERRAIRNSQ